MGLADLQALAQKKAEEYGLDPKVIAAIITVESAWNPNSARFERDFAYVDKISFYAKLFGITAATEMMFQQTSWGPMQVMGGTARNPLGYRGWLPDLCKPEIGIDLGCRYFLAKCKQYGRISDQFAAYNAGSVTLGMDGKYSPQVQDYVKRALAAYSRY